MMPFQDFTVGLKGPPGVKAKSPTDFQYSGPPGVMAPTISGIPEIRSPTDFQYANNAPSTGGGLGGILGAFTRTLSGVGSAVANTARGDEPNSSSGNISTAQVDGQSNFINSLSGKIRGVLDTIGAVGDGLSEAQTRFGGGSTPEPQMVSYGNAQSPGLNPLVIAAVIGAVGVIYVATKD